MDEELPPGNQRIHKMSFKDLSARATAAMKPKPAEVAKTPAEDNGSETAGKEVPEKSKTS